MAIAGIARLFHPTIAVLASNQVCRGINPWFFLIGIRVVVLLFAFGPWDSNTKDIVCLWPSELNGDAKTFCTTVCYNQKFIVSLSTIWAFNFVTIVFTVGLMKLVYVTKKNPSGKDTESTEEIGPTFDGWRFRIYIFCIALILAIEVTFVCLLLFFQEPLLKQGTIICNPRNPACPPTVQCAINGFSDKQGIVWLLCFSSVVNAIFCIGFLASHTCQACGCSGGTEDVRSGNYGRVAARYGCRCDGAGCNNCHEGKNEWLEMYGNLGVAECNCQLEGGNCCCVQGQDGVRREACGCHDNRKCPCYFQKSEVGQSQNSIPSREDSEGKLLRGDIEVGAERKEWRDNVRKMPIGKPLRTGVKKSRVNSRQEKAARWEKRRM